MSPRLQSVPEHRLCVPGLLPFRSSVMCAGAVWGWCAFVLLSALSPRCFSLCGCFLFKHDWVVNGFEFRGPPCLVYLLGAPSAKPRAESALSAVLRQMHHQWPAPARSQGWRRALLFSFLISDAGAWENFCCLILRPRR